MNVYNFLADVVLFIHVLFNGFVVIGLLLILIGGLCRWTWVRNFRFRLVHLTMMCVVILERAMGWRCPLTTWEEQLRIAGGTPLGSYTTNNVEYDFYYAQDAVGSFLQQLIYYNSWPVHVFLYVYLAFGTAILLSFLFVRPRWPWAKKKAETPVPPPPGA